MLAEARKAAVERNMANAIHHVVHPKACARASAAALRENEPPFPRTISERPPGPDFQNSGKAPRVCLIFSRRARAHSGPNAPKEPTTLAP